MWIWHLPPSVHDSAADRLVGLPTNPEIASGHPMPCRRLLDTSARTITGVLGVYFAVTADQERALIAAADDGDPETVGNLLEAIEEEWTDDELKADTDKAWDAIYTAV